MSLRNVEDLLHERGIDICHETMRLWWRRFGPMFANEIRKKRVEATVCGHEIDLDAHHPRSPSEDTVWETPEPSTTRPQLL